MSTLLDGVIRDVAAHLRQFYRPRRDVCWLDAEPGEGPCDTGHSCVDGTCEAPACAAGSERGE